jgi:RNA polymerase sigma-70 factor (ECF subfamily)
MLHAMHDSPSSGTRALLARWREGDARAADELTALVYGNLRRLASSYMRRERADHTLSATGLVHEAYVRLLDGEVCLEDRAHFLAMAAREMRRVLVEHARSRNREKRGGGGMQRVTLDDAHRISNSNAMDMLAVQEALERLHAVDERKARLVDLMCFGGLTIEEAAAVLKVSTATVGREWRMTRAWLQCELKSGSTPSQA